MLESLVIAHSTTGRLKTPEFDNENWLRWNTCIRQLAIGFGEPVVLGFENYFGVEAYSFFLEVISGLHSPIVGETEVMGQFKELIETVNQSHLKNKIQLLGLFRCALTDAKNVRANVLKDMGSRSYGSLLRKQVKESYCVSFLGAGKLVGEILPWFKSEKKVRIMCRRAEQGQKLKEKFGPLEVVDLRSKLFGDTLIIAAPITALEISEMLVEVTSVVNIIDLRESSSRDPLALKIPTMTLAKLFDEIKKTEKDVEQKVVKARALIKELSHKWTLKAEHRPFGWEDLCG